MSFVKIHIDTKHDIRVDSCRRGKRLFTSPAVNHYRERSQYMYVFHDVRELMLTKEADNDKEHSTGTPRGRRILRVLRRNKLRECGERDTQESTEYIEYGEFKLLSKAGLHREHQFFQRKH